MPTPNGRPYRVFALALCGHALVALLYVLGTAAGTDAAATGFPLDDAWIHMVYGRSVAEHGLPLYTGSPEAGCTSPLWMFVLAVAHWCAALLPGSPVFYAKLFGVVAAAATSAAIHDLALRLCGHRGIAALAACLCALLPTLAFLFDDGPVMRGLWAAVAWRPGRHAVVSPVFRRACAPREGGAGPG